MTATIESIYEEGGILRLLAPVPLHAGDKVQIVVNNEPGVAPPSGLTSPGDYDPERVIAIMDEVAALSVPPPDGTENGSIAHDKILYGEQGAR